MGFVLSCIIFIHSSTSQDLEASKKYDKALDSKDNGYVMNMATPIPNYNGYKNKDYPQNDKNGKDYRADPYNPYQREYRVDGCNLNVYVDSECKGPTAAMGGTIEIADGSDPCCNQQMFQKQLCCPDGRELRNGMCYPFCRPGYHGSMLCECWKGDLCYNFYRACETGGIEYCWWGPNNVLVPVGGYPRDGHSPNQPC